MQYVWIKLCYRWTNSNPGFEDQQILDRVEAFDHEVSGAIKVPVNSVTEAASASKERT